MRCVVCLLNVDVRNHSRYLVIVFNNNCRFSNVQRSKAYVIRFSYEKLLVNNKSYASEKMLYAQLHLQSTIV